ncbi:hypothetical protein L1987_24374 [Smallanthus sonchifolius]|uniref:Uncharacterized protein n=1 Tax=Smallanthus sonchifolius TaxID=185202 RepID=A0ACB9IL54_9ASTR|nr:hypothetical protein L1987_24374 [Smallanthus sonchifolius]
MSHHLFLEFQSQAYTPHKYIGFDDGISPMEARYPAILCGEDIWLNKRELEEGNITSFKFMHPGSQKPTSTGTFIFHLQAYHPFAVQKFEASTQRENGAFESLIKQKSMMMLPVEQYIKNIIR